LNEGTSVDLAAFAVVLLEQNDWLLWGLNPLMLTVAIWVGLAQEVHWISVGHCPIINSRHEVQHWECEVVRTVCSLWHERCSRL